MYTNTNFYSILESYPKHIALIPDGGRRWAKLHKCTNQESYSISMNLITQIIDYLFSQGTDYFSVFFSSTFNFKRTSNEINDFSYVEWTYLNKVLLPYSIDNQVKIKIVGTPNTNLTPLLTDIVDIEEKTKYGLKTIYICFNYNSLDEIDIAARQAQKTGESFINYLQIPHPVDILIRTGNANVLSNFMLPQIAMARIFFIEKLFNDFTLEDLKSIINLYLGYELKYGE